jgi:hypothetical protein
MGRKETYSPEDSNASGTEENEYLVESEKTRGNSNQGNDSKERGFHCSAGKIPQSLRDDRDNDGFDPVE